MEQVVVFDLLSSECENPFQPHDFRKAFEQVLRKSVEVAHTAARRDFSTMFECFIAALKNIDPTYADFVDSLDHRVFLEDMLVQELAKYDEISIDEVLRETGYDVASIFRVIQSKLASAAEAEKNANRSQTSERVETRNRASQGPSEIEIFSRNLDEHGHELFLATLGDLQDFEIVKDLTETRFIDSRDLKRMMADYVEQAKKHLSFMRYFAVDASQAIDPEKIRKNQRPFINRLESAFRRRLELFAHAEEVVGFGLADELASGGDDKAASARDGFGDALFKAYQAIFPQMLEELPNGKQNDLDYFVDYALEKLTAPAKTIHGFSLADHLKAAESARVRQEHNNPDPEVIRSAFMDYVKIELKQRIQEMMAARTAKNSLKSNVALIATDTQISETSSPSPIQRHTFSFREKVTAALANLKPPSLQTVRKFTAAGFALAAGALAVGNFFTHSSESSSGGESQSAVDVLVVCSPEIAGASDQTATPENISNSERKSSSTRYTVAENSPAKEKYFRQLGNAEGIKQTVEGLMKTVSVSMDGEDNGHATSFDAQVKLYEALVDASSSSPLGSHDFFSRLRDNKTKFAGLLRRSEGNLDQLNRIGYFEPEMFLFRALTPEKVRGTTANLGPEFQNSAKEPSRHAHTLYPTQSAPFSGGEASDDGKTAFLGVPASPHYFTTAVAPGDDDVIEVDVSEFATNEFGESDTIELTENDFDEIIHSDGTVELHSDYLIKEETSSPSTEEARWG